MNERKAHCPGAEPSPAAPEFRWRLSTGRAALLTLCVVLSLGTAGADLFTKITEGAVVNDDRYSEGSSWGDVNNDGHLDLFVPHVWDDLPNLLFLNNGDATFTQVTGDPVVTDPNTSSGGSFGDFDNDGDLDLFVQNWFGDNNGLYVGHGDGTFARVASGAIVSDGGYSFGSSVVDYDNDGNLDIYVDNGAFTQGGERNFLYKGNGDGTFSKITEGDLVTDVQLSLSSGWCDYDDDGDVDLLVANGGTFDYYGISNSLYQNNADGTFARVTDGVVVSDVENSAGVSWGDYDNDRDFDLFVANWGREDNSLYENNGDGTFSKIITGSVVSGGGHSVAGAWGDCDNDGDLDLFVTNDWDEDNQLYLNNGDGTFTEVADGDVVSDGGRSNGATWADYDSDGFLDLFVPNGRIPVQSNFLYLNNAASGNAWINIRCAGVLSNASAIGTKVRVKAAVFGQALWQLRQVCGQTGFNAQNSFNVEFGLGDAPVIDSVAIAWPSGTVDTYTHVPVRRFYVATEGEGLTEWVVTCAKGANPAMPRLVEFLNVSPNPWSRSTNVTYRVPGSSCVVLDVCDVLGRRRGTLVNAHRQPGMYSVKLDADGLPNGAYVVRLRSAGATWTRTVLLAR